MTTIDKVELSHLTDDELMARLNAGDVEGALAEVQARHSKRITGLARAIVGDTHLAQEVCQDVLAKVFFKSHLYQPRGNFKAWLLEIARNQALTALRQRQQTPLPISGLPGPEIDEAELIARTTPIDVDRSLEERELMEEFAAAVADLPDRYREVFELCVLNGMEYRTAARNLGIPTGTVAIRIMRARKRLFRELSPHLDRVRRPPACFVN